MLCAKCLRRLDTGAQRCPTCGGDPLLGGRYRLDRPLAEAPHESSYRATRVEDGLLVRARAVDVGRAGSSSRDAAARITKLEHRCLPRALEHCEIDGRLWLVHEYVRGRTLAEFALAEPLRAREPAWSSELLAELAGALAYLHAQTPPIAHGQISTQTIWVADGNDPRFRLLDLQLSDVCRPTDDVRSLGVVIRGLLGSETVDDPLRDLLARMLASDSAQRITSAQLQEASAQLVRARPADDRRHPPTLGRARRPTPRFTMLETVANPDGGVSQVSRPVPATSVRMSARRRGDDIPLIRPDELSRELSQAYRATAAFEERQRKQLAIARVAVVILVATIAALATYLAMRL